MRQVKRRHERDYTMNRRCIHMLILLSGLFFWNACSRVPESSYPSLVDLPARVQPIQKSVVTVITFDVNERVSAIGSGFFISKSGILVTNHHVLDGAYNANVRTMDGSIYPVSGVISENQLVDLIKVRVDIPPDKISPINQSNRKPAVADRVFVVGSPMGLEQTVSEGIISAIRDLPAGGKVLQLTAPISRGSSGGPVFDRYSGVIGVVTYQAAKGQNLNFAIAIEALDAGDNVSDVFTVTVDDGDAPLGTNTYTVNVMGADDTPTLGAVTSGSVAEDDQASTTTDSGLSGTLSGSDVDTGDVLSGKRRFT